MSRPIILAILFLSVMFATSLRVIPAEEPFVIDDFETGLGKWYGSGGGGAANGILEETKDVHDDKRAMKITLPKGNAGWTLVQSRGRGAEFAKLADKGYEAFNFWIKGLKGIDQDPPMLRFMLLGSGDHSKDNRWQINIKAPLDEWTFFSIPFKDLKPWNQEKREFKIEFLDYPGFYQARVPWPEIEFIVDQMEVGPITVPESMQPVEPLEKLSTTWGGTKL